MDVAKTVPDTITKWAAGAFCTSPVGFGLAPNVDLTAFKPFFVSLTLPYSVIREEMFTLKASVFNYLPKCIMVSCRNLFTSMSWSGFANVCSKTVSCRLALYKSLCLLIKVKVTLADSQQFTAQPCQGCTYTQCVCSEESKTFQWIVTPSALGKPDMFTFMYMSKNKQKCHFIFNLVPQTEKFISRLIMLAPGLCITLKIVHPKM